jgi:NAD(P)-dependent dehydrogenase (short-subunit alcohol dehydrogenase family)
LARGDRVVATGRDLVAIGALTAQAPERALALRLDVTDAGAARGAMDQAVARFGRVDVVLNNAGYGHVGAIEELGDDELRRQLDVNLLGVVNVTRAALPHMRRQRSGHIVQMSSLNGIEGLPGAAYYAASKFAIEGFSESLAGEVAHLGIRVTVVEPAPFRTRFLAERSAKWAKPMPDYAASVGKTRELLRQMDGRQPGDPERAADAIIQAVETDPPPFRLPLGRMALDHIRAHLQARLGELDAWSGLGASTDFPADEDLVRRAYSAFNNRDVDTGVALMDPEVDWPDASDGGYVHGREQVRRHWREQFSRVDPRIDVADVRQTRDGRVEARVRQIVRDREGGVLADHRLVHVFTVDHDRIKRMDVIPAAS